MVAGRELRSIHGVTQGNAECPICEGEGWVCENHPDKTWGQGGGAGRCECGAGMPCKCTPYMIRKNEAASIPLTAPEE